MIISNKSQLTTNFGHFFIKNSSTFENTAVFLIKNKQLLAVDGVKPRLQTVI